MRRQVLVLLALVGLLVSVYLWLYKIGVIGALQCGAGPCEFVQASRYADFLGVPVAFIGVAGYAAIFVVGLVGLQPRFATDPRIRLLLGLLSSAGFAFTLYLTYIELFVLSAICWWCVASAVIITAIWVIAMSSFISGARRTS